MAEQTALVMLAPDDSIDAIIEQVKKAGANHVDLLMPDGATALQSRKACDKLREMANRASIDLTLYTADPKIVRAAQNCQIMVVELDESALAPVSTPTPSRPAPRPAPVAPRPASAAPVAAPVRTAEEEFLASLELDTAPTLPRSAQPAETIAFEKAPATQPTADDAWAASLDSFALPASDPAPSQPAATRNDDAWDFAAFDDQPSVISPAASPTPSRPRERTNEAPTGTAPKQPATAPKVRRGPKIVSAEEAAQAKRPRSNTGLLVGLLVIGLIALAVWWFFFRKQNVRITVEPPAGRNGEQVYTDVRINFQPEPVNDPSSAAIQGRVIGGPVSVTVRGTVQTATEQPDKTASGYVRLVNRNTQGYSLAAGTRVRTTNLQGEEITYLTTQEVAVPALISSLTGTTFGQADVAISATSPGEHANLPADDSTPWTVESYEGVLFAINPEDIGGGTNISLKIPTEADIRPLLNQAVPQFRNAVPNAMRTLLQPGEEVARIDFSPDVDELVQNPSLYDLQTRPLPETDGDFELILTANFRGLAVPTNFGQQLNRALPNALKIKSNNAFNPETSDVLSSAFHLNDDPNVQILLASVTTAPKSAEPVPAAVQQRIAQALQGLTREQAEQTLRQFERDGLIGRVVDLPAFEQLPADADQIKIVVQQ